MHPGDKARLYHDLGQMIHSGISFQNAVTKLTKLGRGSMIKTLVGIRDALQNGATIPEALAAQTEIDDLEVSLFSASERSGKLDVGLEMAAAYYASVAQARRTIWARMGYPLFILHFAVLLYSVVRNFQAGSGAIIDTALRGFIVLWAVIIGFCLLVGFLARQGTKSPSIDRLLRMLPVIGKMRRSFALSRFCAAYDLQLEAGVNVFSALESSARASGSALIIEAGARALPSVRAGEQVGSALAGTHAFPAPFIQTFLVGEETGRLPHELRQLSDDYRGSAMRSLELLSEWFPRLLYLSILLVGGWQVISFYIGYWKGIDDMFK